MKFAGVRTLVGVMTAALAVVGSMNPVSAQAQSLTMRVKVPFEFHVGDVRLPAGTYLVQRTGEALWIRDGNGHTARVIANAIDNRSFNGDNQLVFNRYLNNHFLSEVRWSEYRNARGLIKSRLEKELAQTISPQQILTAALTR
jgi:hypothetical protein